MSGNKFDRQWLATNHPEQLKELFNDPTTKKLGKPVEDAPKQNKYRNKKVVTETDGVFDSKKEFNRWLELKQMQGRGEIAHLIRQSKFEITVNEKKICDYVADFCYYKLTTNREDGLKEYEDYIVEDVKSAATKKIGTYVIKKKLMQAVFNIEILET